MKTRKKTSNFRTKSAAFFTQNSNAGTQNSNTGHRHDAGGTKNKASGTRRQASGIGGATEEIAPLEEQITALEEQIAALQAGGAGACGNSEYSGVKPVTTLRDAPAGVGDDTVTHLQAWLAELQSVTGDFFALLPQLETTELSSAARMRLNGSGVRRYGFIEKVAGVSGDFPQFWPAFGNGREELTGLVSEIEVLRNLLVWFRWAARVTQDLLLLAGDEAFRVAGSYYTTARDGARRNNPEAVQVFNMLRLFWQRRRRTSEEPTIPEVERDVRALLRGAKDGEVVVRNESDRVVKGKKVIIDNTRKRRGTGGRRRKRLEKRRDQSAE
ncbi:MAG: hypothetical protein FWC50_13545 [Planctomycetaceae bacterium]|nr:hypothetical protein [Planctomycetaceae bacterium]